MEKNRTVTQAGSVSVTTIEAEPTALQAGAFPAVEAHPPDRQRWKTAAALLAAGGLLTACGGLGGGVYTGPFGTYEAAHLLRRATALGNGADAEHLASLGLAKAVDYLLETPHLPEEHEREYFQDADYIHEWTNHWLTSRTPAAERLALFWHGHFTTEASKVGDYLSYLKVNKLRELGLGTFRDLLYMIAEDPAMIRYLDNNTSTKEHPNENWARELMELYTLGEGHYTETDIQQVARAFTGWTVEYGDGRYYFGFDASIHDFEPKQILGQTVYNRYTPIAEGYEVLDIILGMDQTYKFISEKLLRFYYRPDPDQAMIDRGADILKGGTVRDFLKWLFTHPDFYADETRNSLVKSPFEYAVGLFYAAGKRAVSEEENLHYWLRARLDQDPYNPPNVAGWPIASTEWLTDAVLLQRLKFIDFATGYPEDAGPEGPVDYGVFMDGAVNPLSLVAPEAQLL
ncbi:DUF1800 domain-containing protein [Oceanithermus sp.]